MLPEGELGGAVEARLSGDDPSLWLMATLCRGRLLDGDDAAGYTAAMNQQPSKYIALNGAWTACDHAASSCRPSMEAAGEDLVA